MKTLYTIKDAFSKESLFNVEDFIVPRIGEQLKIKTNKQNINSRVIDIQYQYTESNQIKSTMSLIVTILVEQLKDNK